MPEHYVAGMPHLAHAGLSEHWLLKECGHCHWLALARRHGRAVPDFRDPCGANAYAAFTAVRVSGARLERIGENAPFSLDTTLVPAGRAQHYSRHRLMHGDADCGRVEMLSAFVRREDVGSNRKVVRAAPRGVEGEGASGGELARAAARLLETSRGFRAGRWARRLGLDPVACAPLQEARFRPCPGIDFNGAGFLYFASFQSFVEQAEWTWFPARRPARLVRRELYFHGNLDVGDTLLVRLCAERCDDGGMAHWCELVREWDGRRIADVITMKAWAEEASGSESAGVASTAIATSALDTPTARSAAGGLHGRSLSPCGRGTG